MFSIESCLNPEKQKNKIEIHIDDQYDDFLPEKFRDNPQKYIEEYGKNIKSGEIKYHEDGSVREDPTASKFLPEWQNVQGEVVQPISKKVNLEKVITMTEVEGELLEDPKEIKKVKEKVVKQNSCVINRLTRYMGLQKNGKLINN